MTTHELIDLPPELVKEWSEKLLMDCEGPQMAFALLCILLLSLGKLNKDAGGVDPTVDEVIEEIRMAMHSVRREDERLQ